MIDLELALADLAEHLDHPAGDGISVSVRHRLDVRPAPLDRRRPRARALIAAAAALVVVAATIVAVPPARNAVADWLGIGAIEVRRSGQLPTTAPTTKRAVPGSTGRPASASAEARLASARRAVRFPIVVPAPATAGRLADVRVDARVPGGLVAPSYGRFTLVEIATDPHRPPPLAKLIGGQTPVEHVAVDGAPGLWISGVHEIGFLDRSGNFETDTTRRSGPVLMWERAGVTYRIEGMAARADALAVATALG